MVSDAQQQSKEGCFSLSLLEPSPMLHPIAALLLPCDIRPPSPCASATQQPLPAVCSSSSPVGCRSSKRRHSQGGQRQTLYCIHHCGGGNCLHYSPPRLLAWPQCAPSAHSAPGRPPPSTPHPPEAVASAQAAAASRAQTRGYATLSLKQTYKMSRWLQKSQAHNLWCPRHQECFTPISLGS